MPKPDNWDDMSLHEKCEFLVNRTPEPIETDGIHNAINSLGNSIASIVNTEIPNLATRVTALEEKGKT